MEKEINNPDIGFGYVIERTIGKLSDRRGGWERMLRIVAWNGGEPKYDVRDWSPDGTKMGRGITLDTDDAKALYLLLKTEFDGQTE